MREILYYIIYKIIYKIFWIFPVKKNRILFSSYFGKQYSDSPKFIYETLSKKRKDLDIVWVLNDKNSKLNMPGVKIIKEKSLSYLYYLATSKYWIDNCHGYHLRKPRKETIYFQTWHGTPLKKICQDIEGEEYRKSKESWKLETSYWTYLLSPSKGMNEIFVKAFSVDKKILLNAIYPRNEFLLTSNLKEVKNKVLKELKIPENKKIILYAPTFRLGETEEYNLQIDFKKFDENLKSEYVFLIRTHPNVKKISSKIENDSMFIDVSKYDDIQELYMASDILITDYSSVFFDYALLKKPIIFYPYDYEHYKNKERGFYFEYDKIVPGPIAHNQKELLKLLLKLEEDKKVYENKINVFNEIFNIDDLKKNSEFILKKIGLL
ncbi:MAG: CDP-glycerol glycerophosphotransferase family protein [Fusobacteriaceae bacterium]